MRLMRALPATPRRQAGLTLVELMISLTLGLILIAGIATLFLYTSRSNRQNASNSAMQDQARFALAALSRDIAMAGYWGGISSATTITPNTNDTSLTNDTSSASTALTAANDCGADATSSWAFQMTRSTTAEVDGISQVLQWPNRVEFRNQNSGTATASIWRCIGDYRAGTDIVALRRVAGQLTGSMSSSDTQVKLRAYGYYLQTNGVTGTMIRWGAADTAAPSGTEAPLSPPMSFYRYVPRIYYVRNFARTAGDGVPTLCRKELCPSGYQAGSDSESGSCGDATATASASGFYSECLAEGVEDLQIVWGIANGTGSSFRYTSTPNAQDLALNARTAQIFLRMRSATGDASYTDTKTYTTGDGDAYTPSTVSEASGTAEADKAKHYYRRVYSTTVYLHNPTR